MIEPKIGDIVENQEIGKIIEYRKLSDTWLVVMIGAIMKTFIYYNEDMKKWYKCLR